MRPSWRTRFRDQPVNCFGLSAKLMQRLYTPFFLSSFVRVLPCGLSATPAPVQPPSPENVPLYRAAVSSVVRSRVERVKGPKAGPEPRILGLVAPIETVPRKLKECARCWVISGSLFNYLEVHDPQRNRSKRWRSHAYLPYGRLPPALRYYGQGRATRLRRRRMPMRSK